MTLQKIDKMMGIGILQNLCRLFLFLFFFIFFFYFILFHLLNVSNVSMDKSRI